MALVMGPHPVAVAAPVDDEEHPNVVHRDVCNRHVGAAREHYAMRVQSPHLHAGQALNRLTKLSSV